jgi:hypothetical protein
MKRTLLTATILATMAGGGFALAQAPATNADDHAAHHPAAAGAAPKAQATSPAPGQTGSGTGMGGGMMGAGHGMMGGGMCPMMGGGMGGSGMMGGGMGGMGMGLMGGPNTKVDVKKTDKGVTITLTAPDAASAARLQKMAEAMRLMHEASTQ